MSHLYKEMLTVQVLFLGAHHFMSGGFADRSRYCRASHAVLSRGDPIRERLARHLLPLDLSASSSAGKKGDGPALTRVPTLGEPRPCVLRPHGGSLLRCPCPGTSNTPGSAPVCGPQGPGREQMGHRTPAWAAVPAS